jgi:hypothetical protein
MPNWKKKKKDNKKNTFMGSKNFGIKAPIGIVI